MQKRDVHDFQGVRRAEKQLNALRTGDIILERKPAVIFRVFVLRTAVMRPEERGEIGETALFNPVLLKMGEQRRKLEPFPNEKLVSHEQE